ncbi:MAG: histidine kinase [Deltaproteobacteria bacterium]|nr:histidine kinase [Deltaproteobacteria bacterium]
MAETLLEELRRYVGWGSEDERALRALHGPARARFPAIAEVFYDTILRHDEARASLVGGESRVGHLKVTLQQWLDTLLSGPWDQAYLDSRCRIGRVHVKIALPQHYMFGAMNVVRRELNQVIDDTYLSRPAELASARRAVGRVLDLELAIMLHTYREDMLAAQARQERLATFGQLVGSIGHELRNPLSVMETSVYILRGKVPDEEGIRRHLDRIGDQLRAANGIITNLLDIIRDRPVSQQPVALAAVLEEAAGAVALPEAVALDRGDLASLPSIRGDALQLRQVFVNLLENAALAAAPAGSIWVRGSEVPGAIQVAVEDSGPGVDEAVQARLFEPLITTRERGVGLGLALVKRIVERHGGSVAYQRGAAGGACFTVRLPA